MCMHMCTCVCMCACKCMHIHMRRCACECVREYGRVYMYVCIFVMSHTCVCACICICLCMHMQRKYVCKYVQTVHKNTVRYIECNKCVDISLCVFLLTRLSLDCRSLSLSFSRSISLDLARSLSCHKNNVECEIVLQPTCWSLGTLTLDTGPPAVV